MTPPVCGSWRIFSGIKAVPFDLASVLIFVRPSSSVFFPILSDYLYFAATSFWIRRFSLFKAMKQNYESLSEKYKAYNILHHSSHQHCSSSLSFTVIPHHEYIIVPHINTVHSHYRSRSFLTTNTPSFLHINTTSQSKSTSKLHPSLSRKLHLRRISPVSSHSIRKPDRIFTSPIKGGRVIVRSSR
ncbi:PREDICTED: uncharacterized protein LOC108574738 [Habropoda laboriosa]|uniref:uncharacterized protein LOC108574738 n=1 Tax=Habropoda laboriosa TaxID=597456 RepID=UPI00083CE7B2|nr:PREDICTED: uncharacterized protein LOC108574738 [Habropoda laboriosa]